MNGLRISFVALVATGLIHHRTSAAETAGDLRVMTFNIRFGTAQDGENHWDKRRQFVAETIGVYDPDLVGLQESLGFQRDYLLQQLREYSVESAGRDDGLEKGEMTPVFYRTSRFEKLDGGHFWLSETPDKPGSKTWDSSLPRVVSWVRLRDRLQPQAAPLLFVNTHFDHRGTQARLESARLVRERASALGRDCAIIITGDFNASEDSEPYRALFEKPATRPPLLLDAYRLVHATRAADEGTYNNFRPGANTGSRIDWIAVSPGWQVLAAQIDRTDKDGRVPSDHFPVSAVLRR